MPLLFKNGKLVVNDIDQLVFSDDPNSCRCCPGLCECADGSSPRYLAQADNIVSGVSDTYEESLSFSNTQRLGNGKTVINRESATLQISGLSALNGTYPAGFFKRDPSTFALLPCGPEDTTPTEACYFNDVRAPCFLWMQTPIVPITGTFSTYDFVDERAYFPNDPNRPVFEESRSGQITGCATAGLAQINIYGCVSNTGYENQAQNAFWIQFYNPQALGINQPARVSFLSYRDSVTWFRKNQCEDLTQRVNFITAPGGPWIQELAFPGMMSWMSLGTNLDCNDAYFLSICSEPRPLYNFGLYEWLVCGDAFSDKNETSTFVSCSNSRSASGSVITNFFGNVAYDASWSYSHSGMNWTFQEDYTYVP